MEGGERETGEPESEPHRLLRLSEELLRQRDFSGCRNYALQAQHSDPHLARADQILAIADVLLAAQTRIHHHHPNYYSILQLDPLCQDPEIIKNHLKRLIILLNPINNGFSFAEEAFTVLCEAWSVLSEPAIKADYDGEVAKYYRRAEEVSSEDCEGGKKGGDDGGGSFWTACPYCYYLYEYERVYVDCCLRCQNCRRAFHGAIIQSPPPPVPGMEQYYFCLGVFPLGYSGNGQKNSAPGDNVGGGGGDGFVEISDDGADLSDELKSAMKVNEKPMNVDNRKSQEEAKNGDARSGQGGFVMQGSEKTEVSNVGEKRPMMRRKTVARNTKKIMGRGNRGRRIGTAAAAGEGNVEGRSEGEGCGVGSSGGKGRGSEEGFVVGGVEYFEGDDDILVGLPIVDDGGKGKVEASS